MSIFKPQLFTNYYRDISVFLILVFLSACSPVPSPTTPFSSPTATRSLKTPTLPVSSPTVTRIFPIPVVPFTSRTVLPITVTPTATYPPTQTPIPAAWKTYRLTEIGVSLRYPEDWIAESSQRYAGKDGFFELSIRTYADTVFSSLLPLCILEANLHKPDLYGEYPHVGDWQGWAPESHRAFGNGCVVHPSPDAPDSGEGVLFTRYPSDTSSDKVLVLRADKNHFSGIVSTLRMTSYANSTSPSGTYTSPLCILSSARPLPEVSHFSDLTITEYPIVDAACHPYNHFDSFQARVHSLDLKMSNKWLKSKEPRRAGISQEIRDGQDLMAYELVFNRLFLPYVAYPSQLNVLRNAQVIYTLMVPMTFPDSIALWAWDKHWILDVDSVVIIDGEIQNQKLGYDEMSEWHLVNDHPFFFYRQTDKFGIVYNGEVMPERYDELIHGSLCCEPSVYSSRSAPFGARFYAQRDGVWWYVVIETP